MADANHIEGLDELIARLREIASDAKHIKRPLRSAAVYMLGSIERNFQAQGRPNKWTPLSAVTLSLRRKGRARQKKAGQATGRGSRILIDKARLKSSISTQVNDRDASVGTNVIYAPRQQFGFKGVKGAAKKNGLQVGWQRGKTPTPARPFLLFQPEDIEAIVGIFKRHIARQAAE